MKKILPLTLMLAVMGTLTACLHDDDDDITTYTTYNDAALTAFVVTTANQYIHTLTTTGEDSVYMKTLSTNSYKFFIDQQQHIAYNADSLPYGVDAKHLIVTATAKNGGYILLKNMTSDTLSYLTSADSTDFSIPRTLRIYSNDGTTSQDYTVTVNVHQQYGDTLLWNKKGALEPAKTAQHMKLVSVAGEIYLFASDGATTELWSGGSNGENWSPFNTTFATDAWKNVVVKGNELFLLDGSWLTKMDANNEWSLITRNATVRQLIAASSTELYAIGNDGRLMMSSDNGATWTAETLDNSTALLPTENISYSAQTTKMNSDIERVVITGTCDASDYAVSWTKLIDHGDANRQNTWMYVDQAGDYEYALPKLNPLTTFAYDGNNVALGVYPSAGTFSDLLVSRDSGITWKTDSEYYLPDDLATTNGQVAATTDNRNFIWIVTGGNGQLWQGRITRLGWER